MIKPHSTKYLFRWSSGSGPVTTALLTFDPDHLRSRVDDRDPPDPDFEPLSILRPRGKPDGGQAERSWDCSRDLRVLLSHSELSGVALSVNSDCGYFFRIIKVDLSYVLHIRVLALS